MFLGRPRRQDSLVRVNATVLYGLLVEAEDARTFQTFTKIDSIEGVK